MMRLSGRVQVPAGETAADTRNETVHLLAIRENPRSQPLTAKQALPPTQRRACLKLPAGDTAAGALSVTRY
jgi:hypothetical protein